MNKNFSMIKKSLFFILGYCLYIPYLYTTECAQTIQQDSLYPVVFTSPLIQALQLNINNRPNLIFEDQAVPCLPNDFLPWSAQFSASRWSQLIAFLPNASCAILYAMSWVADCADAESKKDLQPWKEEYVKGFSWGQDSIESASSITLRDVLRSFALEGTYINSVYHNYWKALETIKGILPSSWVAYGLERLNPVAVAFFLTDREWTPK